MNHLIHTTLLLLITFYTGFAYSQSNDLLSTNDRNSQLKIVQSVIESKLVDRKDIRAKINAAQPDEVAEFEEDLLQINKEISDLRDSFELIAVGSVDLGVFGTKGDSFNIKNEMTQVMMPIIRNLQSLTEKPRKIEALRTQIYTTKEQLSAANEAVRYITQSLMLADDEPTQKSLKDLQTDWNNRAQELVRNREVAIVKLINLQNNDSDLWQSLIAGISGFVLGRGLTIVLAIAAAATVWTLAKLLSRVILVKSRNVAAQSYRTRQRLVQYAFNILTGLLMMIVIIVVFYVRGDVLLLGISILFAGAIILGLRHTLPKFISEAKLLLNIGAIRENERVVYNGLPFRVSSLNMYSVLVNPELSGIVRLPLESMIGMVSRPTGKEVWFPASKGDYIVMPDGKMLEVLSLTTELIHLQNLAGTKTSIPASDFYNMTFDNLSRGDSFAITSTFGIGYSHQQISNNDIPTTLQATITAAMAQTDFSEHVVSVSVELKEAGSSSLDYWVCVVLSSDAARSYYKVHRVIQQTCVDTCTAKNWDIPFPQLTIHSQTQPA